MKQKLTLITTMVFTLLIFVGCLGKVDTEETVFPQLDAPKTGDTVATIETNMGNIKVKLLPELAPKTVENFTTHAKNGYYNNLIFHRVINNFMVQGGDPTGTGTGGESIWGKPFADEFSSQGKHFRGALSMANSGANTNGSQFFMVQSSSMSQLQLSELGLTGPLADLYSTHGGTPHLDNKHTVFGQIYEGLDILDTMAKVPTDSDDKPVDPIIITTITVETVE